MLDKIQNCKTHAYLDEVREMVKSCDFGSLLLYEPHELIAA